MYTHVHVYILQERHIVHIYILHTCIHVHITRHIVHMLSLHLTYMYTCTCSTLFFVWQYVEREGRYTQCDTCIWSMYTYIHTVFHSQLIPHRCCSVCWRDGAVGCWRPCGWFATVCAHVSCWSGAVVGSRAGGHLVLTACLHEQALYNVYTQWNNIHNKTLLSTF